MMDKIPDVPAAIVVLATLVGGIVGVLTKFLLDRHKLKADIAEQLWAHIYERLEQLEKDNKECTERTTAMAQRIGFLEARAEQKQGDGKCG